MRGYLCSATIPILIVPLLGQKPAPRFELADVHVSPSGPYQNLRTGPVRNGLEVIRTGSMLDLIRIAWGVDADNIVGGPNWLQLDRFDVTARVTDDSTPEQQRQMLRTLLAERFNLKVHEDTKPMPAWALTAGKNPRLKSADGETDSGCKLPAAPAPGGTTQTVNRPNAAPVTNYLGPGMTYQYMCRNMTMAAFAAGLRRMPGVVIIGEEVVDRTGLEGAWDFDVRWSAPMISPIPGGEQRILVADALEKQLGLKLEQIPVPKPVLVVDSVERKPAPNPPGTMEALRVEANPEQFEVADVKMSNPDRRPGNLIFQITPSGRFAVEGLTMRMLLNRAFNITQIDAIAGLPDWADSTRYDITAKAPVESIVGSLNDPDVLTPMLRSLLVERFGIQSHMEQRMRSAFTMVSAKPKLKKADPESRIYCRYMPPGPDIPPTLSEFKCQNVTMTLLAQRLENLAPGLNAPIEDATGLEGGWDFTLVFSQIPPNMMNRGRASDADRSALAASDPSGGYTIFESIEKQLGLKLESKKRMLPVIVIDRIQQKPTDN